MWSSSHGNDMIKGIRLLEEQNENYLESSEQHHGLRCPLDHVSCLPWHFFNCSQCCDAFLILTWEQHLLKLFIKCIYLAEMDKSLTWALKKQILYPGFFLIFLIKIIHRCQGKKHFMQHPEKSPSLLIFTK